MNSLDAQYQNPKTPKPQNPKSCESHQLKISKI
jgi:hypothetical protein